MQNLLLQTKADVICLQEVEISDFAIDFPELCAQYDFCAQDAPRRSDDHTTGVVILWRKGMFSSTPLFAIHRSRTMAVAMELSRNSDCEECRRVAESLCEYIVVIGVHLEGHPSMVLERVSQTNNILQDVYAEVKSRSRFQPPIFFVGDFNSCDKPLSQYPAEPIVEPPPLGDDQQPIRPGGPSAVHLLLRRQNLVKGEIDPECGNPSCKKPLSQPFRFVGSHDGHTQFPTLLLPLLRPATVDFIMYSGADAIDMVESNSEEHKQQHQEQLRHIASMESISRDEVQVSVSMIPMLEVPDIYDFTTPKSSETITLPALPNAIFGSDHLPVGACFELIQMPESLHQSNQEHRIEVQRKAEQRAAEAVLKKKSKASKPVVASESS